MYKEYVKELKIYLMNGARVVNHKKVLHRRESDQKRKEVQ